MEIVLDEHTRIKKETLTPPAGNLDVWSLIWKGKDLGYLHNLAGERTRVNLNENVHLTREGDTWTLWWTTPSNEVLSFVVTAENIRAARTRVEIAAETTVKKVGNAWYLTWKDVGGETAVPLLGIKNDWPALCVAERRLPKLERELADVTKQRDDFRVSFEQANDMLRGKTTRWLGTEHSLYQKNGEWYLGWDKNGLTYSVDIRMLSNYFVDHKKCAELEKDLAEERKKLDEANAIILGEVERRLGDKHALYCETHNGSWFLKWEKNKTTHHVDIGTLTNCYAAHKHCAELQKKYDECKAELTKANAKANDLTNELAELKANMKIKLYGDRVLEDEGVWMLRWRTGAQLYKQSVEQMIASHLDCMELKAKLKNMEHTVVLCPEWTVRKHGIHWRLHYRYLGKEENVLLQALVDLWHSGTMDNMDKLKEENEKFKKENEYIAEAAHQTKKESLEFLSKAQMLEKENIKLREQLEILKKDNKALEEEKDNWKREFEAATLTRVQTVTWRFDPAHKDWYSAWSTAKVVGETKQ